MATIIEHEPKDPKFVITVNSRELAQIAEALGRVQFGHGVYSTVENFRIARGIPSYEG